MKKFSTAALLLVLASASTGFAASGDMTRSSRCAFLPNAPDQHTVVRGDTLWDISGKFLQHAWCWPQVWGMNREDIRNPHWIYPGQIIYLDRAAGRLRLGRPVGESGMESGIPATPTVRLTPQLRTQAVGRDAVASIPAQIIEPFLSQPLVIEDNELKDAPRIIASDEGRVNLSKGDRAYVRGELNGHTSFQAFRPGVPLTDPVTGQVIAYEAAYLGNVRLTSAARTPGEAHVFTVANTKQEIGVGDRLVAEPPTPIVNYVPHPPEQEVDANIVSVYGGVKQAGQNQIVTINRGKNHGIDPGTVLELYRLGTVVADKTEGGSFWSSGKTLVKLPDRQYGSLFVFRVFNNISYGLVMQVTDAVQIGDIAKSPAP